MWGARIHRVEPTGSLFQTTSRTTMAFIYSTQCCLFFAGLLFHRVILMSGSGLAPWSLVGDPARYAAFVSHHVNCSVNLALQQLMKCLREKPLALLLSAPVPQLDFEPSFGPSVDGVVIGNSYRRARALIDVIN